MKRTLRHGDRVFELAKWSDLGPGAILKFLDPTSADAFVRSVSGEPSNIATLRAVLKDESPSIDLRSDREVFEQIRWKLTTGWLKVTDVVASPVVAETGKANATAPTDRAKWEFYAGIVRSHGGKVCEHGKPTVLGIRGLSRDGRVHVSVNSRNYDDTFVVLTPDFQVVELTGATHAGQLTSTLVDSVGRILPGNYTTRKHADHNGAVSFQILTLGGSGSIPGARDRNDDGKYSEFEVAISVGAKHTLTGVLFHQGFPNRPKSIGCQTMSPDEFAKFVAAVGGPGFSYTLVEAREGMLPPPSKS